MPGKGAKGAGNGAKGAGTGIGRGAPMGRHEPQSEGDLEPQGAPAGRGRSAASPGRGAASPGHLKKAAGAQNASAFTPNRSGTAGTDQQGADEDLGE
jgi:hypothetical protein